MDRVWAPPHGRIWNSIWSFFDAGFSDPPFMLPSLIYKTKERIKDYTLNLIQWRITLMYNEIAIDSHGTRL
jgi:hypothetical protein